MTGVFLHHVGYHIAPVSATEHSPLVPTRSLPRQSLSKHVSSNWSQESGKLEESLIKLCQKVQVGATTQSQQSVNPMSCCWKNKLQEPNEFFYQELVELDFRAVSCSAHKLNQKTAFNVMSYTQQEDTHLHSEINFLLLQLHQSLINGAQSCVPYATTTSRTIGIQSFKLFCKFNGMHSLLKKPIHP